MFILGGFTKMMKKRDYRPKIHFSPEKGWMNDPNGMVYVDGVYHFFYQKYPYDTSWGPMHWGHATSRDLIHWEHQPIALYPDELGFIFSGSAVYDTQNSSEYGTNENPPIIAIYTSHHKDGLEQQSIAYSNDKGRHFEKSYLNPVIKNPGISDFRDPKAFWNPVRRCWSLVLAAQDRVFFYASQDMKNWEKTGEFGPEGNHVKGVWECPDLFEIDGQQIMTCCPQGVDQKGYDYQTVYQCGYFPVEFDLKNKSYSFGKFQEFDKGFDIYATQTFADEAGRRILIGWMGIPDADYDNDATVAYDWIHALTMPRELEWKDGKILQHPLKEMKDLRKNAFTCELEAFTKWAPADCCFELRLDVEEAKNLELKLREDVTISWKDGLFTLSMGESGRGRKQRFAKVEELSDITIFSDTSAIEIFINNGETVLTTRVYSEHLEQKVELVSREVKGSVHGYELGSFEVEYKK